MMGVLILLSAVLLVGAIFAALFIYAVRQGEFDDLDDPPQRMLRDD